ncbi:urea ABC transporter substrate-binding protein [Bifidobacterium sp. 82T24]|uniref:Urea ABC transporter substrate-binding protein n=1 Tax=Bifidobacterium saimiriisciurei TaxID=2661627 RepID=A0ABX0CCM4_9BIFI|nr:MULTISPECIES: urea ABC transporter substrate-binding protein [Bifidobacterium]MBW3088374.1 urea ABC transporter substrate-binding protein [Bifidobacterium pluvialisilvae]NEG96998.1 urea ABC transporter substrate-binding protein [Bifidobacterium sp. SMB2]NEH12019.1 urea ABC transporter substrate-binding protein [Bifidobacterium saimiriisciurei]
MGRTSLALRAGAAALAVAAIMGLGGCGWGRTVAEKEALDKSSASNASATSCVDTSGNTIKVGFVNSLSGTMAISEKTVSDSLHMAVDEINADGGVLGKQIQIEQQDGKSEPATFAEKARTLIEKQCVAAVFGGWTSSSRKAMLPVFEEDNALLFYPLQYEGMESSPNIFYSGAAPNQQIVPALDYLKEQGHKKLFLVGSDYVFPQTANRVVKAYAEGNGMEVVGEEYTPMGSTDFTTIVNKLKFSGADAVVNTLNGDSNVAFFKEYKASGLSADKVPVISMSIAEEEVASIGVDNVKDQLTAWNYYQTLDNPENKKFVKNFKAKYGESRPTSDPMESAYTSVYLWKKMVEKAKSFDVDKVKAAADGVTFDAPEGQVKVDGKNHHIYKTSYIGKIGSDKLIHTVWKSDGPIAPDPYLKTYDWAKSLSASTSGSDGSGE